MLQLKEKALKAYLVENKWMYKNTPDGPWIGYAIFRSNGMVEHKFIPESGENQLRITHRGLAKLSKELVTLWTWTDKDDN